MANSIFPHDFRIDLVPVHYEAEGVTEYEVQIRWTDKEGHSEVVPLYWSRDIAKAQEAREKAISDAKIIVGGL